MLTKTYRQCKSFKVSCESQTYPLGDLERLKRENKSISIKAKRKEIVEQIGNVERGMKPAWRWNIKESL